MRAVSRNNRTTPRKHRKVSALVGATALVATAALGSGTGAAAPAGKLVTYHGVSLRVPAAWPVIDLARHPDTCARLDRHAVYLGTPGDSADCPPRILGRTETISLRPAAATAAPGSTVLARGVPEAAPRSTDHTGRVALAAAGVELTTTYGNRPELVDAVLASARITEKARPRAIREPESEPAVSTKVPGTFVLTAGSFSGSRIVRGWACSVIRALARAASTSSGRLPYVVVSSTPAAASANRPVWSVLRGAASGTPRGTTALPGAAVAAAGRRLIVSVRP